MRVGVGLLLSLGLILSAVHAEGTWRVVKDHWAAADEAGFARFVEAIGDSTCSSSQSCLRDAANPFRGSDKKFLDIDTDCAKWPYLLRAYYAWKNGLPFSYVDAIAGDGDERHSRSGNRPVSRHAFIDRGEGINGPASVRDVIDTVSSATYRSDAAVDGHVPSDFYAPKIAPGVIRPGTVIYDTNAHVAIVYKVDGDGRIYYMDAHPDFTITRSVYGPQFGQSPAKLGGGLKNWRPQRLVGAHANSKGDLIGGRIVLAKNAEIAEFSLEQYRGTEPNPSGEPLKARFVYDGEEMGLYAYVRTAMSGGKTHFNPLHEMKLSMRALCSDLKDRASAVNLAIAKGLQNEPHPSRLPQNIFDAGEDGWWESYATPARDARLRNAFVDAYKQIYDLIDLWVQRDPRLVYDGADFKADMLASYDREAGDCDLTYLNSQKMPVQLTLADIPARLYALSFDPYDCIEARWGDTAKTCSNGEMKWRWYHAEQRLRSMATRETHIAFSLDALERDPKPLPPPKPIDIRTLIATMPDREPLKPMSPVGR